MSITITAILINICEKHAVHNCKQLNYEWHVIHNYFDYVHTHMNGGICETTCSPMSEAFAISGYDMYAVLLCGVLHKPGCNCVSVMHYALDSSLG